MNMWLISNGKERMTLSWQRRKSNRLSRTLWTSTGIFVQPFNFVNRHSTPRKKMPEILGGEPIGGWYVVRGASKGGGYGGQNPPPLHWPKFFGHFYQNSNKMTVAQVFAALFHPQNPPPLRPFLAMSLIPGFFSTRHYSVFGRKFAAK